MKRSAFLILMMLCLMLSSAPAVVGLESVEAPVMQEAPLHEIEELRTVNSKTYPTDQPGEYRQVIYPENVHYEGQDGKFYDIQTELYDEIIESASINEMSKYSRTANASESLKTSNELNRFFAFRVPFELEISKNIRDGYSIGKDGDRLTFLPQQVSPVIGRVEAKEKDKIRYDNLWPHTSMTIKVMPNGIKEDFILHNQQAPTTFSFEVMGDLKKNGSAGNLLVQPAWLVDNNGIYRDVQTNIRHEKNKTFIDFTLDTEGLAYPITVDPSVSISSFRVYYSCSNDPPDIQRRFLCGDDERLSVPELHDF